MVADTPYTEQRSTEIVSRSTSVKQGRPATRVCRSCGNERSLVLFPRWRDGKISSRCQVCTERGVRKLKELGKLVARSRRGARRQKAAAMARKGAR